MEVRRFDFQTNVMAGVVGPDASAKETQTFIHRVIAYQKPMGWKHQAKNKLLLDVSFTAEKQMASYKILFELKGVKILRSHSR